MAFAVPVCAQSANGFPEMQSSSRNMTVHISDLQHCADYGTGPLPSPARTIRKRKSSSFRSAFWLLLLTSLVSFPLVRAFDELADRHFHGCALVETPYVYEDEKVRSGFRGVAITYLTLLQQNLQFSYNLSLWNGTARSLVNHMATCQADSEGDDRCECDIGVGPFTMSDERVERVNFVWAFAHENYRMVTTKTELEPDASQGTWYLFNTFTSDVWIVILCGIVLHSIGTVFFWPFRRRGEMRFRDLTRIPSFGHMREQLHRFPAAMLFSYAHLIGYPIDEGSRRSPSFHRTAWLVLGLTSGLFLLTVYEASLTVLLFETAKTSRFNTISDFSSCEIAPEQMAVVRGSAAREYWNNAVNTTANRKKCHWDTSASVVETLEEGFQFLKEGRVAYFFDLEASILFRAHQNCDVYEAVGDPFFSTSIGFIMPKTANMSIVNRLSHETRILRESDQYESATILASRNSCEDEVDATITLGKLQVFFSMYLVAWGLLIIYRCIFLCRQQQRRRAEEDGEGMMHFECNEAGRNRIKGVGFREPCVTIEEEPSRTCSRAERWSNS